MKCSLKDLEDTPEDRFPVKLLPVMGESELVALINQKATVTGKDDLAVAGGKEDSVAVFYFCLMMSLFQKFVPNLVNMIPLVACRGALFLKSPPCRGVIGLRLRS